jgi:putative DNA methylase
MITAEKALDLRTHYERRLAAGGGSIPLEALRLGHTVCANELNPVASVILHATLDCPSRCGPDLASHIPKWGDRLLAFSEPVLAPVRPDGSSLPSTERAILEQYSLVSLNSSMSLVESKC